MGGELRLMVDGVDMRQGVDVWYTVELQMQEQGVVLKVGTALMLLEMVLLLPKMVLKVQGM